MQITDRYKAVGKPWPNPKTVCQGYCEGMGVVPVYYRPGSCSGLLEHQADEVQPSEVETDPRLIKLWWEAHEKHHKISYRIKVAWLFKDFSLLSTKCDGWHFVKCPDCGGTGVRNGK